MLYSYAHSQSNLAIATDMAKKKMAADVLPNTLFNSLP